MSESNVCDRCRQPLRSHETISVANVGLRCYRCFNEETAAMMGVDFDNTPLQPITVSDADGIDHTFEFRSMLVGTGHALYARERLPEGRDLPNLNAGLMASVPVILPPRSLQDRFEAATLPMAELIETLLNQNAILRQTRDLLLPRLLSGQLRLIEINGLAAKTTASQALAF